MKSYDRGHRAQVTSSPITSASRRRMRVQNSISRIARFLSSFLFICGPSGERRLANYDKQMRLGNAAVDDCSSQGLPDFYFSLSLFFFLLASFFLSRSVFHYFAPRAPFAPCSLPLSPPGKKMEREGGGAVWWRRRRWKKRLTQRLLFASFVIPLISLPACRTETTAATFFLERVSLFFFCHYFFLFSIALHASLRPVATPTAFSAPRTAVYFYCNVLLPPILQTALPRDANLSRRAPVSFYPCCSCAFFRLFFLSFFQRRARVVRGQ